MRSLRGARRWRMAASTVAAVWLAGPALAADSAVVQGRQLFLGGVAPAPACALCHTLKEAGATGEIGPNLDELKPDAARIEHALRNGMGPMPAFKALTDAQIDALVRYVSNATGTAP